MVGAAGVDGGGDTPPPPSNRVARLAVWRHGGVGRWGKRAAWSVASPPFPLRRGGLHPCPLRTWAVTAAAAAAAFGARAPPPLPPPSPRHLTQAGAIVEPCGRCATLRATARGGGGRG